MICQRYFRLLLDESKKIPQMHRNAHFWVNYILITNKLGRILEPFEHYDIVYVVFDNEKNITIAIRIRKKQFYLFYSDIFHILIVMLLRIFQQLLETCLSNFRPKCPTPKMAKL